MLVVVEHEGYRRLSDALATEKLYDRNVEDALDRLVGSEAFADSNLCSFS